MIWESVLPNQGFFVAQLCADVLYLTQPMAGLNKLLGVKNISGQILATKNTTWAPKR